MVKERDIEAARQRERDKWSNQERHKRMEDGDERGVEEKPLEILSKFVNPELWE